MTGAGPVRSELSLHWSAASGQVAEGGSAAAWQDLAAQAGRLAEPVGVQIPADHTPSYREWSETVPSSLARSAWQLPLGPVAELANPVNRPGTNDGPGCRSGPAAPRSRVGFHRVTDGNRPGQHSRSRAAGHLGVDQSVARLGCWWLLRPLTFLGRPGTGCRRGWTEIPSACVSWPEQPCHQDTSGDDRSGPFEVRPSRAPGDPAPGNDRPRPLLAVA